MSNPKQVLSIISIRVEGNEYITACYVQCEDGSVVIGYLATRIHKADLARKLARLDYHAELPSTIPYNVGYTPCLVVGQSA